MMGIILFYMYTGQPLFEGLSFPQAAISYMTRTYPVCYHSSVEAACYTFSSSDVPSMNVDCVAFSAPN